MRIGKTIGSVTLCRWHPLLAGATYRLAAPMSLANLTGDTQETAEELVLLDELGAGDNQWIAITEGPEAAQPFYPEVKPIDAYCTALLDQIDVKNESH